MTATTAIARSLAFWHWYPEVLLRGLTREQLRWQPEGHDSSIGFATWHAYRAADDLCNGFVLGRAPVYAAAGWASRLPVEDTGATAFGNGLTREGIARLDFDPGELAAYAKAVGNSLQDWVTAATEADASAPVSLPFFAEAYPGYDTMTKMEAILFFAVGHTAEHLGEVQLIRGLMGLKGAPL